MVRYVMGALGAALVLTACGCVGPTNNRLYATGEWRSKVDHPIQVDKNWQYEGEHWEHYVFVDHKKTAKEREEEE